MSYINKCKDLFLSAEFIWYIIVGIMGVVVDFAVFYLLQTRGVEMLFAQWIASFIGFSHNHLWQHFKVFNHNQCFKKTYSLSLVVALLSIAISGPMLVLLNQYIDSWVINKLLIIAVLTVAQYIIRKKWIFYTK